MIVKDKVKYNLDRIDSNSFEVDQIKDRVNHLDEEMKVLRSEDTQNRGLRETLIFKNIPSQQK